MVTVNVPAPEVTIYVPGIRVTAPDVNVNVPEISITVPSSNGTITTSNPTSGNQFDSDSTNNGKSLHAADMPLTGIHRADLCRYVQRIKIGIK